MRELERASMLASTLLTIAVVQTILDRMGARGIIARAVAHDLPVTALYMVCTESYAQAQAAAAAADAFAPVVRRALDRATS